MLDLSKTVRFSWSHALCSLACLGTLASCSSSSSTTPMDGGPTGDTGVPWGPQLGIATKIEQTGTTFKFVSLEGPYWVASGNYLLFSDVVEMNGADAKIYKYEPASGMFSVYPYPTPMPASTNGLGMDSMGRLVATERVNHRVTRVEGTPPMLKELAATYPLTGGKNFDAPNDLVIDSKDNIYFSDTRYGSLYPEAMLIPAAAYRISGTDGSIVRLFEGGPVPTMNSVNGIALSKDGKSLYLGDDTANKLWKLPLNADGLVDAGVTPTLLADQAKIPGNRFMIPDGINIDDDGKIYVAINHHDVNAIAVFGEDGTYMGRYDVPVDLDIDPATNKPADPGGKGPSNISFGGADRKTMFITTLHGLWKATAPTGGKP